MNEPIALLRIRDVVARTGLARSTVYRLAAKGEFPAPIRLLGRNTAFPSNLVDKWITQQIDADAARH